VVFKGRRIVLGVCGGIAAYKAVEVCRRLSDQGALVSVILSEDAQRFIGALTFSALSSEPAWTSMWDAPHPSPHTLLGQRADLIVVSPMSARALSSYATGDSRDLLSATLLATRAPVLVCPAMHTEMWEHPAVQENITTLNRRGVYILEPAEGRLAGGDVGKGRLAEPVDIVAAAEAVLAGRPVGQTTPAAIVPHGDVSQPELDMVGLHVLVTAGGTRESIDPVRFIGNRSSGRQGYAFAEEAIARGATVSLISTVSLPTPTGAELIRVESAAQMQAAVEHGAPSADVIVMAAAVADFRPVAVAAQKIKKDPAAADAPTIALERTPDILAGLGATKAPHQVLVGFAAETHDLAVNAAEKLRRKRADFIVANDVSAEGAAAGTGFEHETNAVSIYSFAAPVKHVALTTKRAIASAVFTEVLSVVMARRHGD
jgi:phosphopantothenoylcysteine decarboxylase / phosphopantothenate---cysteine ligase